MFSWFRPSIEKIGFEDITRNAENVIIINTLPSGEQDCLIQNTLSAEIEERTLNGYIERGEAYKIPVIVYGRNSCDESAEKKCGQLAKLGFREVYWYVGGLFEWLLLQDIYGKTEFKTTGTVKNVDLLKYRPTPKRGILRIGF